MRSVFVPRQDLADLLKDFFGNDRRVKKEGNEERSTLEAKTNGLPDLSLMPPEELNMLACGLDKIISKILETE